MTDPRHRGPRARARQRMLAREALEFAAHRIVGRIEVPEDFRVRVAAGTNAYRLAEYLVQYNVEFAVQPTCDGIYVNRRRSDPQWRPSP